MSLHFALDPRNDWHVVRHHGPRYWLSWKLSQLSLVVKDTTTYTVLRVKLKETGEVIAEWHVQGDYFGAGVVSQFCSLQKWRETYAVDWLDFKDVDEYFAWMDSQDALPSTVTHAELRDIEEQVGEDILGEVPNG